MPNFGNQISVPLRESPGSIRGQLLLILLWAQ